MGTWFTELQVPGLRFSCQIKDVLFTAKSKYQEIAVYDTVAFGRMLSIDGAIMATDKDEFIYHEMLAHVPLMAHPRPERVLVIGGGDGGVIREVVRHPGVKMAHLVEIDEMVIEVSRDFFPRISSGLDDPRVRITVGDGIEYIKSVTSEYDVIIVDSTDPVGPAAGLFAEDFYAHAKVALKPQGIFTAQTESPLFNAEIIRSAARALRRIFPVYRLYLAGVPTYPSGVWCYSMGSLGPTGDVQDASRFAGLSCKYYTPLVHAASFVLPAYVAGIVSQE